MKTYVPAAFAALFLPVLGTAQDPGTDERPPAVREQRRDQRQETREERRDERQDARQERRDERQEQRPARPDGEVLTKEERMRRFVHDHRAVYVRLHRQADQDQNGRLDADGRQKLHELIEQHLETRRDGRQDARDERRDERQDGRDERRDQRQDVREERRDERQDGREERRDQRQDTRKERRRSGPPRPNRGGGGR
jgi:hypothetical protein